MNIEQLHNSLQEFGVPPDRYYLHGLFGSSNDEEKLAMSIKQDGYYVYFTEYGEKTTDLRFPTESEACDYLFKHIRDDWTLEKISRIEGFGCMTVNERLHVCGLSDEFEDCKKNDIARAKQILRMIRVDESSISSMFS